MRGDVNLLNGFTLGDAIFVAHVWAGQAVFPWTAQESDFPWNVCNENVAFDTASPSTVGSRRLHEPQQEAQAHQGVRDELEDQSEEAGLLGRVRQLEQLLREKDEQLEAMAEELAQHKSGLGLRLEMGIE